MPGVPEAGEASPLDGPAERGVDQAGGNGPGCTTQPGAVDVDDGTRVGRLEGPKRRRPTDLTLHLAHGPRLTRGSGWWHIGVPAGIPGTLKEAVLLSHGCVGG